MRTLGLLLIWGGFLAGAYFSVLDTETVPWHMVGPCLVVGLIGVVLVQLDRKSVV